MKKFIILLPLFLGFLGLLILAPNTYSYPVPPVTVGQEIKFADGPGTTNGGEFKIYDWNSGNYIFDSFCLEKNEYISYGKKFIVGDISTYAELGGEWGGTNGKDPLDPMTAYLYHHFFWGTLSEYNYLNDDSSSEFATRADSANALQEAIWYIEEEIEEFNGTTPFDATHNYYTQLAFDAEWPDIGDVRVINLIGSRCGRHRQDQLTVAPVPEPATMFLLGSGLIGLAAIGRKKFRKK